MYIYTYIHTGADLELANILNYPPACALFEEYMIGRYFSFHDRRVMIMHYVFRSCIPVYIRLGLYVYT
jgi:hypothetical protein